MFVFVQRTKFYLRDVRGNFYVMLDIAFVGAKWKIHTWARSRDIGFASKQQLPSVAYDYLLYKQSQIYLNISQ